MNEKLERNTRIFYWTNMLTDKSTASPRVKLARFLNHLMARDSAYFFDDGYPRHEIKADAHAFLTLLHEGAIDPPGWREYIAECDDIVPEMRAEWAERILAGANDGVPALGEDPGKIIHWATTVSVMKSLRELRVWLWKQAMHNRAEKQRFEACVATSPHPDATSISMVRHRALADMQISWVQALNSFFPSGDTVAKDCAHLESSPTLTGTLTPPAGDIIPTRFERRQGTRMPSATGDISWGRWEPCTDAEARRVAGLTSWDVRIVEWGPQSTISCPTPKECASDQVCVNGCQKDVPPAAPVESWVGQITEENCGQRITDMLMQCAERLGNFPRALVDERAWRHLLTYAPKPAKGLSDGRNWSSPDDIRAQGWSVGCHNDYVQAGDTHTFWLFTRGKECVKGEGRADAEALNYVRAALGSRGLWSKQ